MVKFDLMKELGLDTTGNEERENQDNSANDFPTIVSNLEFIHFSSTAEISRKVGCTRHLKVALNEAKISAEMSVCFAKLRELKIGYVERRE